jgi:hypothetical protein
MKEGENMTKHIHKFWSRLQQLTVARAFVQNNKAILSLMKSMPTSY